MEYLITDLVYRYSFENCTSKFVFTSFGLLNKKYYSRIKTDYDKKKFKKTIKYIIKNLQDKLDYYNKISTGYKLLEKMTKFIVISEIIFFINDWYPFILSRNKKVCKTLKTTTKNKMLDSFNFNLHDVMKEIHYDSNKTINFEIKLYKYFKNFYFIIREPKENKWIKEYMMNLEILYNIIKLEINKY